MPRKSGFVRHRRRRKRRTYGDSRGRPTVVFRTVIVVELPDVRERMKVAQRRAGLQDQDLAKRIGVSRQAFCQMWRRRQISERVLGEIESALGVDREYWTAPLEVPERVPPKVRLRQIVEAAGRVGA